MLRVLFKSDDPCFQCGKTRDTAVVKGPNFSLVLCKDHAWEKVPENAKKEEKSDASQSVRRSPTA